MLDIYPWQYEQMQRLSSIPAVRRQKNWWTKYMSTFPSWDIFNHKKEFIRLSVDPDIISKKAKKNKIAYKQTQKELKHLYCRVRALERSASALRRHEASYEMMQNILLEGTGSAWIND